MSGIRISEGDKYEAKNYIEKIIRGPGKKDISTLKVKWTTIKVLQILNEMNHMIQYLVEIQFSVSGKDFATDFGIISLNMKDGRGILHERTSSEKYPSKRSQKNDDIKEGDSFSQISYPDPNDSSLFSLQFMGDAKASAGEKPGQIAYLANFHKVKKDKKECGCPKDQKPKRPKNKKPKCQKH